LAANIYFNESVSEQHPGEQPEREGISGITTGHVGHPHRWMQMEIRWAKPAYICARRGAAQAGGGGKIMVLCVVFQPQCRGLLEL
jgi:hypothetical protein